MADRRQITEIDFDEPTDQVKKLIKYKGITFYVTDGPEYSMLVNRYIQELKAVKVNLIIRTNNSKYETENVVDSGIAVFDMTFKDYNVPDEVTMNQLASLFQGYLNGKMKLNVAIQGYEDGPFVVVYGLMILGMKRLEALTVVRQFEGEASYLQSLFLRKKENELTEERALRKSLEPTGCSLCSCFK